MNHDEDNEYRERVELDLRIKLIQAIVLSAFLLSGVALFAVIAAFEVDGYLPTLAYGVAFFLSWKRFFGRRNYKH